MRRRRPSPRRTGSAGAASGLSLDGAREALPVSCTRPQCPSCSAAAHVHDRPSACICVPVRSRIECMTASMALWKLTAAHYATRSCVPLLCATRSTISSFAVDRSALFAMCPMCTGHAAECFLWRPAPSANVIRRTRPAGGQRLDLAVPVPGSLERPGAIAAATCTSSTNGVPRTVLVC